MSVAIKVVNLSKQYRIGAQQHLNRTLREKLNDKAMTPFRVARHLVRRNGNGHSKPLFRSKTETIWALKDVSFEISSGEVVGIIGRNGAGKSTLLKILSRITEPTEGYADIHGRIASLLEVGTGFHLELTGRENIFLNGSILGMKSVDIRQRFDEIVAFAEVDKFIDTPVKFYSSGMYVRLAFAVAAHLDPDILLVDEVLAVGDAGFRKKCLGKMDDVARQGRTVLFVSHDMTNIATLCRQALLLEGGRIAKYGDVQEVITDYLADKNLDRATVEWNLNDAPGDEVTKLTKVAVHGVDGEQNSFSLTEPIKLSIEFAVLKDDVRLNPVLVVKNHLGASIFSTSNYEEPAWGSRHYGTGRFVASCSVPPHILNEGKYVVDAMLVHETRAVRAQHDSAVSFTVFDDGATRGDYVGEWAGIVRPRCLWETSEA